MCCISTVIEWVQIHSAFITTIATIVLVVITLLYLPETRRIRLDSVKPHLMIIPFVQNTTDFYLIIINEGRGSAFNVKGEIKYPVITRLDSPEEYIEELLNITYRPISPGLGVKIPLEKGFPSPLNANIPKFIITLTYDGIYEKNIPITQTFSFDVFTRKWDEQEKNLLFRRYSID